MHSSPEPTPPAKKAVSPPVLDTLRRWNSRLHYYLGLYLLFFIWLFALSGLLLNHSAWKFAEFWPNRQQSSFEREIVSPPPGGDLVQARAIMGQLGIKGEIDWTETRNDPSRFNFRASRPGQIFEIKADLSRHRATVRRINLNQWGTMQVLHAFTGVRQGDPRNDRDWILTTVWALAMDAVAAGLIIMVLSSLWMWYELPQKRRIGSLALLAGLVVCGLFCFGLRWLF